MDGRFGLTIPQRGVEFGILEWRDLLDLARRADGDDLFSSVWVGDSILAKPRPDSIALLGALAGVTDRVTLAVGCMASFPIREPVTFAYQWATLDRTSNGRMLLAACTGLVKHQGASEAEGQAVDGIPDRERARRLEDNMEICRRLWSGEETTFEGEFKSFENVTLLPRPLQDPCPIWLAANPSPGKYFDTAMRRVAEQSDGWMGVNLFPRMLGNTWARLSELLTETGKDPASFPNVAYHNINVGDDRDACLEESQRFLDEYYGQGTFTPEMVAEWTATGTPEECVEHLRQLFNQGMKHVTLRITSWDQFGNLERLVEEVLPNV